MIVEIFIAILITSICFLTYVLVLSLRRINQYEDFVLKFNTIITYASEQMKTVDASGHYEADDETGFFFSQLKELQSLLNSIFEEEKGEEQNAKESEKDKEEK